MSEPGEHERRVDAAIADYLAAAERGQAPPRAAWLAANPELAADLAAFLDDRAHLHNVAPRIDSDDTLSSPTAPDPQAPLGIVRYFGDYELLEEIARGGMGVVYRARQMSLNRIVALKMILAGRFASPADVQRFRTEAEAAANLDHPNILPIYEVGEHEGQQYFSMKLIQGATLTGLVHENPPVATGGLIRILVNVARAVHFAHQRGILHRDLKPANILLDGQGTPFVSDFGLAKRVEGDSGLTQSGAIVGTPSYMAPEQAAAQKTLSTAVDVYSLGAVLYECLTGRPPFKAATPLDTVLEVLEKEPARPTNCDRDLATVALKCLEKQPAKRYDSAAAFAEELERWQRGEPIIARPVGKSERAWRWAKRNPLVASLSAGLLASLLTGVLVLSALLAYNRHLLNRSNDFATDAGRERALRAHDRLMRRYAADAQRMIDQGDYFGALPWLVEAYAGQAAIINADTTVERTRLAQLERHSPRLLRRFPGAHRSAVLSPDGRRVLTAGESWGKGEVRIWDAESGKLLVGPIALTAKTYTTIQALFSPDGSRFLTAFGHQAHVWESTNGKLLSPTDENKKIVGTYAQFASDGRRLLTRLVEEKGRDFYVGHARLWDGLTGEPLTPPLSHGDATHVVDAALSPDSAMIVTAGSDGTVRLWHAETGQPAAKHLKFDGELKSCQFRPDGKIVMIQANEKLYFQSLPEYTRAEYGDASEQTIRQAWFRPDGKFLIARDDDGDLFICDGTTGKHVDGSNVKPDRSGSGDVVLSPDGLELAVRGIRDEFIKRVRLSQAEIVSPRLPGDCGRPAEYSRDGSRLLTFNGRDDACLWDLVTPAQLAPRIAWDQYLARAVPLPGSNRALLMSSRFVQIWDGSNRSTIGPPHEYLSNRVAGPVAIRPDGGVVAFVRNRDVHLLDTNTGALIGQPMTHVANVVAMQFSPDGGRLAISGGEACHLYDCSRGGQRVELAQSGNSDYLAFSPDGRWTILGSSWGPLYNRSGGGILRWYDLYAGGRLAFTREHAAGAESGLEGMTISPDSKWLLSMGGLTARLWNVATATPHGSPLELSQSGESCAFASTASGLVATGCEDGTARIWSISDGHPVTPPLPVGAPPTQITFTADDRFLITRTDQHTRVWDARTGEAVGPAFEGSADGIAADGRLLVVYSGLARWIDLSPSERTPEEWRRRSRVYSRRQIDPTGGYVPVEGRRLDSEFDSWHEPAGDGAARQIAWHRVRSEEAKTFWGPGDSEPAIGSDRVYDSTVAIDQLNRWAELAPADPLSHFRLARVFSRLKDWKGAETAFTRAIELGKRDAATFAERGRARHENKRHVEAAADFAAAGPGLLSNRIAHALSLFAARDGGGFRKARDAQLSRALSGGENERLAAATLVSLDPVGADVSVAILGKWFQFEFIKSPGHRFESNFRAAQVGLMVRTGEFQAAIEDVTKTWPGHLINSDPRGWFWLAIAHHKLGQKAEAQKAIEEGKRILAEQTDREWQDQLEYQLIRDVVEAELRR